MNAVVIFDADNTLWDTDGVFRAAQLALLSTLADTGLLRDPMEHLCTLRCIDQALVRQLGQAEYDFRVLAAALTLWCTQSLSVDAAVNAVLSGLPMNPELLPLIDMAHQALETGLHQIPRMFPDTEAVLTALRASSTKDNTVVTIMLTEGKTQRLERILEAHQIRRRNLFDAIIIAPKCLTTFAEAKQIGLEQLARQGAETSMQLIMIGDSLQRDIMFGNQVGCTTVYKPAVFKGYEIPRSPDEVPHYVIERLQELPAILCGLGLCVHTPSVVA